MTLQRHTKWLLVAAICAGLASPAGARRFRKGAVKRLETTLRQARTNKQNPLSMAIGLRIAIKRGEQALRSTNNPFKRRRLSGLLTEARQRYKGNMKAARPSIKIDKVFHHPSAGASANKPEDYSRFAQTHVGIPLRTVPFSGDYKYQPTVDKSMSRMRELASTMVIAVAGQGPQKTAARKKLAQEFPGGLYPGEVSLLTQRMGTAMPLNQATMVPLVGKETWGRFAEMMKSQAQR